MGTGEVLEEAACGRLVRVSSRWVTQRPPKSSSGPRRRSLRDPPPLQLGEPDILLDHPGGHWPDRAMSRRWPGEGKSRGRSPLTIHDARTLRRRHHDQAAPQRRHRHGRRLFARLGLRSRERRFCGAKPRLGEATSPSPAWTRPSRAGRLRRGDPCPAGIARLPRRPVGRIAFEVADAHQGRGIGSVLARELAADARAAGSPSSSPRLRRQRRRRLAPPAGRGLLHVTWQGREREFVLGLER